MMTIMGIVAAREGVDLRGMTATTKKVMSTDAPRRIASVCTVITMPIAADHPYRAKFEQAAHTCPMHKSLREAMDASVEFVYAG